MVSQAGEIFSMAFERSSVRRVDVDALARRLPVSTLSFSSVLAAMAALVKSIREWTAQEKAWVDQRHRIMTT